MYMVYELVATSRGIVGVFPSLYRAHQACTLLHNSYTVDSKVQTLYEIVDETCTVLYTTNWDMSKDQVYNTRSEEGIKNVVKEYLYLNGKKTVQVTNLLTS